MKIRVFLAVAGIIAVCQLASSLLNPANAAPGVQVCDNSLPPNCAPVDPVNGLKVQAPVTQGIATTNGEPADATGTFTNATQTGNVSTVSVDGYGTALITINGTYGTASATFLASDDGGVSFKYALGCSRTDGSSGWETGYTSLTNVSRAWLCPAQGFDSIEVLSSAVASGTVNVRVSQSSAPTTAANALVEGGNSFTHISTSATTVVKSGSGYLHTITVNNLGTVASTTTIYDNTAGSGTVIAVLNTLAGQTSYLYDVKFAVGLTVVTTGTVAPDITASWR